MTILYSLEFACPACAGLNAREVARQAGQGPARAVHCQGCAANAAGAAYGCSGALTLPLSEAAEWWLLGRLPGRLDCETGWLLRGVLASFDFGSAADTRRLLACGGQRTAPTRSWGWWPWRTHCSSSQLLHLLFAQPRLFPAQVAVLAQLFGPWRKDACAEPEADEPRSVAELKAYLRLLALAASMRAGVALELR
jgi:hypothetical protein